MASSKRKAPGADRGLKEQHDTRVDHTGAQTAADASGGAGDVGGPAPGPDRITSHVSDTVPITFGLIKDYKALEPIKPITEVWGAFKARVRAPQVYATKDAMPLIVGYTFGDRRSAGGSYRHGDNVETVTAIVLDYDAGVADVAALMAEYRRHDVAVAVFTSPSWTPERPRVRMVFPLSRAYKREEFHLLVAKANAIGGAWVSPETFSLSQAFYFGRAATAVGYHCDFHDGRYLDLLPGIKPIWVKASGNVHKGGLTKPTESDSELQQAIRRGSNFHDSVRDLTARWVSSYGPEKANKRLMELYEEAKESVPADRMGRLKEAFEGREYHRQFDRAARMYAKEDASTEFVGADALPAEEPVKEASGDLVALPTTRLLRFAEPANPNAVENALTTTKSGAVVNNVANAALLLSMRLRGESASLHFDNFSRKVLLRACGVEVEVEDKHVLDWTVCIQLQPACQQIGKDSINDAVSLIAAYNSVDTVFEYLNGLAWDRTKRLASLLSRGFGAEENNYTKVAGTNFLVGAVARQFRPGAKVDNVLVLEGPQGIQKSSGLRVLFTEPWFSDSLPSFGAEDFQLHLQGKVCFEAAELHAIHRGDIERTKNLLTMQSDRFRPKFGRRPVEIPRRCVFAGTTNQERYLMDQTGNRRFIPVECGAIDLKWIADNREQLFAEAVALYRLNHEWWRYPDEARAEQELRRVVNGLEEAVLRWSEQYPDVTHVTAHDILAGFMNLPADRAARMVNQMADALKANGFVRNGRGATSVAGVKLNWFRRNDHREGDPIRTALDAQMNVERNDP